MTAAKEHFVPSEGSDYLTLQHIERYRFAVSALDAGMKVLDIASGDGYGSAMLSESGMDVTGCDYNEDLVKMSSSRWKNNRFLVADALALQFDDSSFDAVVSFETIEHVTEGDRFLEEMSRVLKPGGTFICSTPNIDYTSHPPFHVREYRAEEFFGLVREKFSSVEEFGQYFTRGDRISDLYAWHFRPLLVGALERTGTKEFLRRVLGRDGRVPQTDNGPKYEWIRDILKSPQDPVYGVRPYRGEVLLRIMVALARKRRD